ncbi:MAG: hypothetical protein Fur002_01910 [Anaerolineales bacterium]
MTQTPPPAVLALLYWLHMLATVIWVGSLSALNLLILPAAQRTLDSAAQLRFIAALQKRLEPLAWFCMAVLVATGLFQMSANAHYNGFLDTSTQWSLSILVKHSLGILMVALSAVQTWEVIPSIQRTLMKKNAAAEEVDSLRRREINLLRVNFALSVLILAATAFARAA